MGADGGFRATSITDIKENWEDLRERLIESFENRYLNSESYMEKYALEEAKKCRELPKNIESLSNYEVVRLFDFLKSCDCPTLLGEYMITAEGDNVAGHMEELSWTINRTILESQYIETWT